MTTTLSNSGRYKGGGTMGAIAPPLTNLLFLKKNDDYYISMK